MPVPHWEDMTIHVCVWFFFLIKRNTLIGEIEEGGIGIVDTESKFLAATASWIFRILDDKGITFRTLSDILHKTNL